MSVGQLKCGSPDGRGHAVRVVNLHSWLQRGPPPASAHREEGSRLVVMRILGSRSPACAYSSSMWVRGTAVLSSSSSTCSVEWSVTRQQQRCHQTLHKQ